MKHIASSKTIINGCFCIVWRLRGPGMQNTSAECKNDVPTSHTNIRKCLCCFLELLRAYTTRKAAPNYASCASPWLRDASRKRSSKCEKARFGPLSCATGNLWVITEHMGIHGSLFGTHGSLLGTHGSLFAIHGSLLDTHRSLLGMHGPLLSIHGSLLGIIKRTLFQVAAGNRVHDLQQPCGFAWSTHASRFERRMASNGGWKLQMNQWLPATVDHSRVITVGHYWTLMGHHSGFMGHY